MTDKTDFNVGSGLGTDCVDWGGWDEWNKTKGIENGMRLFSTRNEYIIQTTNNKEREII